jgi:hypothetical protein
MSRLTKFLVTLNGEVHEADTAKEVSRLLGRKVTRAQIIACMVPEVQLLEDKSEDSNNTDTIKSDEGDVNMEVNESIQEQVEEVLNGGTEVTSEDEQTIADFVADHEEEEGSEEPVVCDGCGKDIVEGEEKYVQDDGTILCEECNHAKNLEEDTPGSSTGKTKMEVLMEKMRELNAKNAGTASSTTSTKSNKKGKTDAQAYIVENNGYPEVGYFKDEKDLKKFYKQLDDTQLNEWLEVEGLDYKPSDNEPINRMRKCMAILYLHFPRESKGSSKSKSKYADYTTEDLLQMAIDNNVEVREPKGTDQRILRMYTIMALKDAGILQ